MNQISKSLPGIATTFMTRRVLITGITGQDGSYLAEHLLERDYSVSGVVRPGASLEHIRKIEKNLELIEGDLTEREFVRSLAGRGYSHVYNLASVATVARPWEDPEGTVRITGYAPLAFLEAIREIAPAVRFFQASSAEMYGDIVESPQNESTPFRPRNIYGISKLFAHHMVESYRRDQNVFAVSGILFNHESPRRSLEFVTRKITSMLGKIARGEEKELVVGNLDAKRDWSFAGDIVEAMVMALEHEKPETYVMASGQAYTVREFIEIAASEAGMDISWEGEGENEIGKDQDGNIRVRVSSEFYRPLEAHVRKGDISKISKEIGWKPKTPFPELAKMMVRADK